MPRRAAERLVRAAPAEHGYRRRVPPRSRDARPDVVASTHRTVPAVPAAGRRPALVPLLVVAGAALAAVVGVLGGFRAAGLVLAAVLALTAVARAVLPAASSLVLVVRSRGVDVTTAVVLAVGVTVLALTAPA